MLDGLVWFLAGKLLHPLFSNTNILKRIIKQRGKGSAGKNEKWSSGAMGYWTTGDKAQGTAFRGQGTASSYKTSSCILHHASCISLSFVFFVCLPS